MTKHSRLRSSGGAALLGLASVAFLAWWTPSLAAGWPAVLVLVVAAVVVPLGLDLLTEHNDPPAVAAQFAWLRRQQPVAAVLLAIAQAMPVGLLAALGAFAWFLLTAALASVGVRRALRHGWARPLDRLAGDIAVGFLAAGALVILIERSGLMPSGALARGLPRGALHLHWAGFVLPLLAAQLARRQPESRGLARIVVALVLAVPAVVVGGILARLGVGQVGLVAGLAVFWATEFGLGLAQVRWAVSSAGSGGARVALVAGGAGLGLAGALTGVGLWGGTAAWWSGGVPGWLPAVAAGLSVVSGITSLLAWQWTAERTRG